MSSIDINLAGVGPAISAKNKKLVRLRRGSLAFIVMVGALSVILFVLNLFSPLNSIKKEQDGLLASITASQEKAVKIAIVNERASSISKIYKERPDYTNVLDLAVRNISEGVTTSGLNIDESSVTITVSSSSLLSLNNFLNSLIDDASQNSQVKSVSMESLSASDISTFYLMSVKINLK